MVQPIWQTDNLSWQMTSILPSALPNVDGTSLLNKAFLSEIFVPNTFLMHYPTRDFCVIVLCRPGGSGGVPFGRLVCTRSVAPDHVLSPDNLTLKL